jgi:hypothetical protein
MFACLGRRAGTGKEKAYWIEKANIDPLTR